MDYLGGGGVGEGECHEQAVKFWCEAFQDFISWKVRETLDPLQKLTGSSTGKSCMILYNTLLFHHEMVYDVTQYIFVPQEHGVWSYTIHFWPIKEELWPLESRGNLWLNNGANQVSRLRCCEVCRGGGIDYLFHFIYCLWARALF